MYAACDTPEAWFMPSTCCATRFGTTGALRAESRAGESSAEESLLSKCGLYNMPARTSVTLL